MSNWFTDLFLGTEDSGEKRDDYLKDRKTGEFEDYATEYKASADKWADRSEQFFDPNSQVNQSRFGILNEAIQDQTASGIRDWKATMAQQGTNVGSSGIGAQNVLQARRRAGGDASKALNEAYQNSFGLGMNAARFGANQRSRAMGATGQADAIYAGANNVKMQQDTANAGKIAGFAQMVGGAALGAVAPGMGSLLGGAMEGLSQGDGMMAQFAKPYAQNYQNQQAIQDSFSGLLKYTNPGYQVQQQQTPASYADSLYAGDMSSYQNLGRRRVPSGFQFNLAGYGD